MSQLNINTIRDASGGNNAVLYGVAAPSNSMGFRNRIINGDMRIDQRNNGASVINATNYIVDRWADFKAGSGGYTAQRSTTAPVGFTNSFQHTVTTAVSPAAGDVYQIIQPIEGYNTADLGFGTASAQAVTVSFWVRSSVTGLYSIFLYNSAGNRSYVATYSIAVANTWEQKSITIAGDTSGTWLTDNGLGISLGFDLGSGSNQNTTAGAWQAGAFRRTSGCVNWISTNGATFYITGVQLEAGTVATPFERRDYGRELMMCQRYFARFNALTSTTARVGTNVLPVQMRASPTVAAAFDSGTGATYTTLSGVPGTGLFQDTAHSVTATANITVTAEL